MMEQAELVSEVLPCVSFGFQESFCSRIEHFRLSVFEFFAHLV
jgi:hypothetical protein